MFADDAVILAFPDAAQRRLRVALRKLDQAMADQRAAVAAFQAEIVALKTAMEGLGDSTLELREKLSETAADTARAQTETLRLQAAAELLARLA